MQSSSTKNQYGPLITVTFLFFMWGFLTVMNDILVPYLKGVFQLNHFKAMLVQFAFFIAYFIGSVIYFLISVNKGDPIMRIGYKNGLIAGLLISAAGIFLFYPASIFQVYGLFLSALFILGLGFTVLQIAANPYVAILGDEKTASSRLNLAQAFNSLGTTLAPALGGFLIFRYFGSETIKDASAVQIPYLIFGAILILLVFFIKVSKLPAVFNADKIEHGAAALKYPHLVFGMFAIFCYVGAEVSIGSIMISFLGLKEIAGLSKADASHFVSLYWGGQMIGRFIGAVSLSEMKNKYLKNSLMSIFPVTAFFVVWNLFGFGNAVIYSVFLLVNLGGFFIGRSMPARTLTLFAILNVILLMINLSSSGNVAMWSVIGIGLFNSIMWSNIFTLAIRGLGKHTSQGSSLLVMMILGGAVMPPLQGAFADAFGVHLSFFIPIICYLYIIYYGISGHKQKLETL